ncbi:MAG: peptidylprolyl isomerase [Planctomycetota bacterium]|nr:MAG: peptidylprolyl isomerase [Planctomycetota bacterium]
MRGLVLIALVSAFGCAQSKTYALIETDFGTIKVLLYEKDAPKTCANFIKLAKSGFYDGLTFHRVVRGHVIQGGCPKGDGTGGPGWTIPLEITPHKHIPGAVGMARGADPNSAGSQFYICLAPRPHLDGKFCVFGQVVEGMEVVRRIESVEVEEKWVDIGGGRRVALHRPKKPVYIRRVRIVKE